MIVLTVVAVVVVVAVAVVVTVPTWLCSMSVNEAKSMVDRTKKLNTMFFVFMSSQTVVELLTR
jgi:hypothetical protein